MDEAAQLSEEFEGDYRPPDDAVATAPRVEIPGRPDHTMNIPPANSMQPENRIRVSSEHVDFLLR